jgi:hypothetical protein
MSGNQNSKADEKGTRATHAQAVPLNSLLKRQTLNADTIATMARSVFSRVRSFLAGLLVTAHQSSLIDDLPPQLSVEVKPMVREPRRGATNSSGIGARGLCCV